jgi:hypothetical protein
MENDLPAEPVTLLGADTDAALSACRLALASLVLLGPELT